MPASICATEVNLVAVIARRIVRSGDHDARRKISLLHGEGKHRGRHALVEKKCLDAGGCHNFCAVACKDITVHSAVVADNRRWSIEILLEVCRQASCCLGNQHAVHAVRASSQLASQASGAKAEPLAAPIKQRRLVASGN